MEGIETQHSCSVRETLCFQCQTESEKHVSDPKGTLWIRSLHDLSLRSEKPGYR